MAEITFTIPNEHLPRIVAAMKGLYPVPTVDVGTPEDPDFQPEFTDGQWAKEATRRWIIKQVQRWETKLAQDAINIQPDEDIAA